MDILQTAKQTNMDVKFSYALDPIEDSPLYILPSVKASKSIPQTRLNELLQKVEEGAVLYMCADEGLLRQIPQIIGVDIEYREGVNTVKTLNMHGLSLPIHTTYFYKPESYRTEVVGTDENGVPVFFKYSYGKGFVYFLTLPLEAYLTNKSGAFFKDDAPDYSCVYRELAQTAKIKRVCDSDNKFVRLTEHTIDEISLYVVAINYNNKTEVANLFVEEGYRVSTIYGEEVTDLKITMQNNDGIILKLEKDI